MTFRPDSPLVDRVLEAPREEWYSRAGYPILAPLVHMAEGGGTDTHLARLDGNSSHYVVKYDGDLVQMVPELYAAGSVKPTAIRTGNDAPFSIPGGEVVQYGITALRAVLSPYSPTYVNRLVIAIEVEGFAKDGPNVAQTATLKRLIADIARRRPTVRGLLGHRDAQDYKACPGKRIPWHEFGGHGVWLDAPDTSTENPMAYSIGAGGLTLASSHVLKLTRGVVLYDAPGRPIKTYDGPDTWVEYYGNPRDTDGYGLVEVTTGYGYADGLPRPTLVLVRDDQTVASVRKKTGTEMAATAEQYSPCPAEDCNDEVAAAIAADRAKARITYD